MKDALFTGVCTALVTPYLGDQINYPMMQQLLSRQMDAGIRSVVVCGTTGEASTLSDEEKRKLFRCCKEYAGNRCQIIAGTGSNNTAHAIELSIAAENEGADALLVVSPYYNKATPQGLYAHYAAIAGAVKIPVILYNVPSRTGVDIPVSIYKQLSSIPNIAGVKEASTDIKKILHIRAECPRDFCLWTGNDEHTVPAMSLGAQGVISVVSNVCPVEMEAMISAALAGDFETAAELQYRLLGLMELLFCEINPIPVKEAMKRLGFDCGGCRLPLCDLSEENKAKFDQFFS